MSDPRVRIIGCVTDFDGRPLPVGVDYDKVTVGHCRLTRDQAEEFAHLFIEAAWEAAACVPVMSDG